MKAEAEESVSDFMNECFFSAVEICKLKLGEGEEKRSPRQEKEVGHHRTSTLTQEWLEEAKRMVGSCPPSRRASPARSGGGLKFVSASQQPQLDRRDARSRSARRNRSTEGISHEILQRSSARHNRNSSDFNFAGDSSSPAGIQNASHFSVHPSFPIGQLPPMLPSRSRFLDKTPDSCPRRSFRTHSSSTRPPPENVSDQAPPLSPPRNLLKSSSQRSVSSFTPRRSVSSGRRLSVEVRREEDVKEINAFLRRQRAVIDMASDGEVSVKAKFVLSSYTPDTSSMVAAICYAWLLENMRKRDVSCVKDEVVVPVINMRRARMWEHKQAAWLFHHIGIDASALIFSDELDLEGLLMGKQLSLLIVGQNALKTNGEVGSLCTILTDKYCEDAYDLLQAPHIRRLLLAGILLDTQNLSCAAKPSTNRDSEAVQLLLVGSFIDYRDFFFHQVMKEHEEESFIESMRQHYGKLSIETKQKHSTAPVGGRAAVQQTQALPPAPFKATEKSSRVKNKFTLGRLFNFSS